MCLGYRLWHTHAAHHGLHRYFMSQVHKNSVKAKTVPMDTYIYIYRSKRVQLWPRLCRYWNHCLTIEITQKQWFSQITQKQWSSLGWCLCACVFACLLVVTRLQCTWDHTKTVILTEVNVCVLSGLPACLLWLDSSVSEITQKQWFSEITQKQWFSLDLMFVCLLACLLWLDSSASEITQKQWFPGITQKQWFSLDLMFVCLFACWFACHCRLDVCVCSAVYGSEYLKNCARNGGLYWAYIPVTSWKGWEWSYGSYGVGCTG